MLIRSGLALAAPIATNITNQLFSSWLFLSGDVTGLIAILSTSEVPAFQ